MQNLFKNDLVKVTTPSGNELIVFVDDVTSDGNVFFFTIETGPTEFWTEENQAINIEKSCAFTKDATKLN